MGGSSDNAKSDLQNAYARLQLEKDEEGSLIMAGEEEESNGSNKIDSRYCLVGGFLTDKVINFAPMKNTMAGLSGKGVIIKYLSPTLFLFQFFHEIDIKRVLESGPWTFDQHILLVHRLGADEQTQHVHLFHTIFWIQVCNLPIEFQSETILQSIGNSISAFLESDQNNFKVIWGNYIRLRVLINVRKPLKRRIRLKRT